MAVDVTLWGAKFAENSIPSWPCPKCDHGRLLMSDKGLNIIEPAYSEEAHSHEAWEPDWTTQRFSLLMKCSDKKCGEIVVVSGDTEIVEEPDDDDNGYGWTYVSHLRPQSIFPAPPIIVMPKETPDPVRKDIKLAFQLFWSDLGASASKLRTSVERLLDDFGIAKTRIDAKKKKRFFLSLASRIDRFKNHKQKPTHSEILDALRHVGNLGTHSDVDRQSVLAGFAIYEEALAEIYGKRTKKAATLAKKIIKGKGKLK